MLSNEKIVSQPDKEKILSVFFMPKIIARLISSFFFGSFFTLIFRSKHFYDIGFADTKSLVTVSLFTVLFFALISLICIFVREITEYDSLFLFISLFSFFIYALLDYDVAEKRLFFMFAAFSICALGLLYFIDKNEEKIEKIKENKSVSYIIISISAVTVFVMLSLNAVFKHLTFFTVNYDFGIFCNMFENMKRTGLPLTTCERDGLLSHFAVHFSPIYYLILPFYLLFPSPTTLGVSQAFIVVVGVVFLYLILKKHNVSDKVSVLLCLSFLFYPALASGCDYDIHENCFLTVLLLGVFCFLEYGKYIPMYIFVLLVLCVKEDAAVFILIFAVFIFVSKKKYIHGIVLLALSILWFFTVCFMLNKYGTGVMNYRFENLMTDKDAELFGVIKTIVSDIGYAATQLFSCEDNGFGKIEYIIMLFVPLMFLPFLSKDRTKYILILPIFINLLTNYPYQYRIGFQYSFAIIAFLFYGAALAISDISKEKQLRLASLSFLFSLLFFFSSLCHNVSYNILMYKNNKDDYILMEEMLDEYLPHDAAVTSSAFIIPHIADRAEVYETYYHDESYLTEYGVVDLRFDTRISETEYFERNGYIMIAASDNLAIYQRHEK